MSESKDAIYVLDANVFIQASRQYYAFDLLPSFWEGLIHSAESGRLITLDKVKEEIVSGSDELASWMKSQFSFACVDSNSTDVIEAYSKIIEYVAEENYKDHAKNEFASCADGWLVAYSMVSDAILVTHEQSDRNSRKRVKIPDVCNAFDVKYMNTFEMIRALGMKIY